MLRYLQCIRFKWKKAEKFLYIVLRNLTDLSNFIKYDSHTNYSSEFFQISRTVSEAPIYRPLPMQFYLYFKSKNQLVSMFI